MPQPDEPKYRTLIHRALICFRETHTVREGRGGGQLTLNKRILFLFQAFTSAICRRGALQQCPPDFPIG